MCVLMCVMIKYLLMEKNRKPQGEYWPESKLCLAFAPFPMITHSFMSIGSPTPPPTPTYGRHIVSTGVQLSFNVLASSHKHTIKLMGFTGCLF